MSGTVNESGNGDEWLRDWDTHEPGPVNVVLAGRSPRPVGTASDEDVQAWDELIRFVREELPSCLPKVLIGQLNYVARAHENGDQSINGYFEMDNAVWSAYRHNLWVCETYGRPSTLPQEELEAHLRWADKYGPGGDEYREGLYMLLDLWEYDGPRALEEGCDTIHDNGESEFIGDDSYVQPGAWDARSSPLVNLRNLYASKGLAELVKAVTWKWRNACSFALMPIASQLPATGREAAALPFEEMWQRMWYPVRADKQP